jgi:peptidoglycan-N-acetylglucosamine deacetylase
MAPKRPFLFTTSWDDGTVHDLRLAELLSKYDLPATFYISKHHNYGSLPETKIRELGQFFELGAHTLNHVILNSVSDEIAETEINRSKSWIEQLRGKPCKMFCFPRGKFRRQHLKMVQRAGFTGARTVELMSLGFPALNSGIRLLGTSIQCFPHKSSQYLRNIVSRRKPGNLWCYLQTTRGKNWPTAARSLLVRAGLHTGVFHLWGHAWEIEQFGLWQQLEEFFRAAAECRTYGMYVTNGQLCSLDCPGLR